MRNVDIPWQREFRLLALLLFVLTVAVYLPALHGGFIWDDNAYVTRNPLLRSFAGLYQIWFQPTDSPQYYPLTHTSFWLEYRAWGLWPFGYHLTNVLLHTGNAILLWCVLRQLAIPGAWLAAAIFALHPVHVESVAWITERKNVLSGFFALASLLCYLRFTTPPSNASSQPDPAWRYYCASLFLYTCSLFSKTVTCSLPAVILIIEWWKKGRLDARAISPLLPMFGLGLVAGLMTIRLEKEVVGAIGDPWNLSLFERFLIAGRALWFYLGKLFWPHNLTFIYPRWDINAAVWWQYLFPLGVLVATSILMVGHKRFGRGPLSAWLIFAGILVPALGFFNVYPMRYSYVADHFQYLASTAIITLAASALWRQTTTPSIDPSREKQESFAQSTSLLASPYRSCVSGLLLLSLGFFTWQQGYVYKNVETLWTDTLVKHPSSWMAHNNLGAHFLERHDYPRAMPHLRAAAQLDSQAAEPRINLALTLLQESKLDEAIHFGREAIRLQPNRADAYNLLGRAFWKKGEVAQAVQYFREAIQQKPTLAQPYYNLGTLLLQEAKMAGDTTSRQALIYLEQALTLQPDSLQTLSTLARALATHPDATVRNGPRAVKLAEQACKKTRFRNPALLDILAMAYAEVGRFAEATITAQQAITHARLSENEDLSKEILKRLQFYQAGTTAARS